jgi:hypothetical protein
VTTRLHEWGDSTYTYEIYDLWGNVLAPITVNEQNDVFTDDFPTAITGWHYDSDHFTVNDKWPPGAPPQGAWNLPQNGINTFTDFIGAISYGLTMPVWNPQTQVPQGLKAAVQHTPQYFYVGSASNGMGVFVRRDTQTWYTDHGTCTTVGGSPCQ